MDASVRDVGGRFWMTGRFGDADVCTESTGLVAHRKDGKSQAIDIVRFLWKCMHMQWVWHWRVRCHEQVVLVAQKVCCSS